MAGEPTYELYIDVFTPSSISMARLAAYMSDFADLLGHSEHVHFENLTKSSLVVSAVVEDVARPKVYRRLEELRLGGQAADSARKAAKNLDDKLSEDNAVGFVRSGGTKIIEFPGRHRPQETKIGPIVQAGSLDGEVIMIGGKDASINVHLRSGEQIYHCVTTKVLARRLAAHIFAPIRVSGTGTWARLEFSGWVLKRFEITDFAPLEETSLSKLFEGLRSRLNPPEGGRINPADLMRQLREE